MATLLPGDWLLIDDVIMVGWSLGECPLSCWQYASNADEWRELKDLVMSGAMLGEQQGRWKLSPTAAAQEERPC